MKSVQSMSKSERVYLSELFETMSELIISDKESDRVEAEVLLRLLLIALDCVKAELQARAWRMIDIFLV